MAAMSVQIDKGVPIPRARGGRGAVWPWRKMDVGDSFFAAGYASRAESRSPGQPVLTVSHGARVVPGSRWAVRAVVEDGIAGVRVWRTA